MTDERTGPSPANASAESPKKEGRAENCGCVCLGLGFLVTGVVLLLFFFSGVKTKRGNPLMGLIGGAMFSFFGLLALASGLAGLFRKKR
jgi:hypothetical protein